MAREMVYRMHHLPALIDGCVHRVRSGTRRDSRGLAQYGPINLSIEHIGLGAPDSAVTIYYYREPSEVRHRSPPRPRNPACAHWTPDEYSLEGPGSQTRALTGAPAPSVGPRFQRALFNILGLALILMTSLGDCVPALKAQLQIESISASDIGILFKLRLGQGILARSYRKGAASSAPALTRQS